MLLCGSDRVSYQIVHAHWQAIRFPQTISTRESSTTACLPHEKVRAWRTIFQYDKIRNVEYYLVLDFIIMQPTKPHPGNTLLHFLLTALTNTFFSISGTSLPHCVFPKLPRSSSDWCVRSEHCQLLCCGGECQSYSMISQNKRQSC